MCECVLTVSNDLLMSSATVFVRSGGLFWLNYVAMVLFMLYDLYGRECVSTRVLSVHSRRL